MKPLSKNEKAERIYAWLNRMKPGTRVNMGRYPEEERTFIDEIIKEYIDAHPYGNGIEFSNDYKYVIKKDISILKTDMKKRRKMIRKLLNIKN